MDRFTAFRTPLSIGLSVLAVLLFAYITQRVLQDVQQPLGSYDFHAYWYEGHIVRQGDNPYRASLQPVKLQIPFTYLDGATEPRVGSLVLPTRVTNTAPLVLLLSGFAYFSWNPAKLLWAGFNLLLALVFPWLLLRAFPLRRELTLPAQIGVCLISYAMVSTRASLANGQTTYFVLTLMLLAVVLRARAWLVSGILLGIALSKYSLVLPAVFYLMFEGRARNILILVVAGLVQGLGLLLVSWFSGDAPLLVAQQYLAIFSDLAYSQGEVGVQISRLVGSGNLQQLALSIFVTAFLFVALALWWRVRPIRYNVTSGLLDFALWIVFIFWTMLVFYHGGYDLIAILPAVPMLLLVALRPIALQTKPVHSIVAWIGLAVFVAIFCLPRQVFEFILRNSTNQVVGEIERVYAFGLLALYFIAIWLVTRAGRWHEMRSIGQASSQPTIPQTAPVLH